MRKFLRDPSLGYNPDANMEQGSHMGDVPPSQNRDNQKLQEWEQRYQPLVEPNN